MRTAPGLAAMQRALAASILDPAAEFPLDWIVTPGGVDPAVRLGVYVGGYPARIAEALAETFPAIAKILGDAEMHALAERYCGQIGERHLDRERNSSDRALNDRNLNYIGRRLEDFLGADPLAGKLPFLPDLARLEWSVVACFHAEVVSFDLGGCADWNTERWERARIGFQAGVQVVRSTWPLLALRESRHQERESIDIDVGGSDPAILVYRAAFDVVTEAISEAEADAFERLRSGSGLGEVMAAFADSGAEPEQVTRLFSRWVSLGLVRSCD